MNQEKILNVINTIANNIPVQIQCYSFHLILKSIFPEVIPYYNHTHVISKIGDKYYDIDGVVTDIDGYILLVEYGNKFIDNLIEAKETFYRWKIDDAQKNKKYLYR